ncbi:putative secreted protein [Helicobacter mustelae]|uniref:conjugal transfer protein TraF n=1 Tax=Helicobacter mustelae TaxID=217 RepID=UPI000E0045D0|nr:conjugal transfer protein TraF [Helicobacter mustelae]STP12477.1 putative secreted protein [Helicobacter mustelae]
MKTTRMFLAFGFLFSTHQLFALPFGGMGNVSASMGGAGVALKNSAWGLYYNPALLGTGKKARFAYSFGAKIRENNLLSLGNVDVKNLQSLPDSVAGLFGTAGKNIKAASAIRGASLVGANLTGADVLVAANGGNLSLPGGVFGDVIQKLLGTKNGQTPTTADLTKFLDGIAGTVANNGAAAGAAGAGGGRTLDDAIKKFQQAFKDNPQKVLDETKGKLLKANAEAGNNPLLGSIIANFNGKNIEKVADLLKEATNDNGKDLDVSKVLATLGGVTVSRSGNASLDKAIKDINLIQKTLRHNNFSLSTQNGLVFQSRPNEDVGGFGVGIFVSGFASGSANFDKNHDRIIVDAGGKYIDLGISGNGITLSSTDQNAYNNNSIFSSSASHHVSVAGLLLGEIPVGYGHSFSVGIGELSVGMTLKYIYGMGYKVSRTGGFNELAKVSFSSKPVVSQNFGIDVGALYSLKGFSIGVVAKNVNNPRMRISETQNIYLNPQVRAGVSYEWGIMTLAFDADLLPNNTLSYAAPKTQMIGGGAMFDLKFVDLRFGAMQDLKNLSNEGLILTGGINLFGFLDIAVQSNMHLTQVRGYSIPSYFSVKVGGTFSW